MTIRVRIVKIDYQVTWAEDDGDDLKLQTGGIATALAADLDNLPNVLRAQAKAWETELNERPDVSQSREMRPADQRPTRTSVPELGQRASSTRQLR